MGPREIAVVGECLFCSSHVVFPVALMCPDRFQAPSRKKAAALQEEWLEDLQALVTRRAVVSMPCPYCVALLTGQPYAEWRDSVGGWSAAADAGPSAAASSGDALSALPSTPLLPFRYVAYDVGEDPALYVNTADACCPGKKKWALCQGVGPQTLDLDRSRSGKVYKKSYRGSGLSGAFLTSVETRRDAADATSVAEGAVLRDAVECFSRAYWQAGVAASRHLVGAVAAHFSPVLLNAHALIDALSAALDDPLHGLSAFLSQHPPGPATQVPPAAAAPPGAVQEDYLREEEDGARRPQPPAFSPLRNAGSGGSDDWGEPAVAASGVAQAAVRRRGGGGCGGGAPEAYRSRRHRGDKREEHRRLEEDVRGQVRDLRG